MDNYTNKEIIYEPRTIISTGIKWNKVYNKQNESEIVHNGN